MASHSVPPEIAQRVIRLITDRHTLTVLARTTRTLQSAAEKKIYDCVEYCHHPIVYSLCMTLARCPRVAAHVRTFILNSPNRTRDRERDQQLQFYARQVVENPAYWEAVHRALLNLQALDFLYISDPTFANSWVLEPPNAANFGLRTIELRLYLPWDEHVALFLDTQDRLRMLCVAEIAENVPLAPLANSALPNLTHFEGPLMLVDQLLRCPITHLKCPIDSEDAVSLLPLVLPELSRFKKLRSLCIVAMPLEMVSSSVAALSLSCPRLKYLSIIPWPIEHKPRLKILQCLARLAELTIIELDITHWMPLLAGAQQRAFAIELRMVLPRLKAVFFWNRHERFVWMWNPDDIEPVRGQHTAGGHEVAGGAGAGTAGAAVTAAGEEEDYIGIEGWKLTWSQSHWMAHGTTWKSSV